MHAPSLKIHKEYSSEDKKRVLTKALMNLAKRLALTRREISAIIGLSEPSLSRIFSQSKFYVDPSTKEGQLAILLLRLFRSLDTLLGGDVNHCKIWLRSNNKHLDGEPIRLIQSIEGLVTIVRYLEAMRGKN